MPAGSGSRFAAPAPDPPDSSLVRRPAVGYPRAVMQRRLPGRLAAATLRAMAVAGLLVLGLLVAACTVPLGGDPGGSAPAAASASPGAALGASPLPSGSTPSRPLRPTPTPAPTFAAYTVRVGDTLISLARRFETTEESLAYWNRDRYPSLDPESPAYRPGRIEVGWQLAYIPGAVVDPESLPPASAAPTAEPGASGIVEPYPTLPPDGSAALVPRGPAGLDTVALTFEYAGGAGGTEEGGAGAEAVVQWLEANRVPATVFVGAAAAAADDAAGAAVLGRLRGARAVSTGLLADIDTADDPAAELTAADAALTTGLGRTTVPWLRPAEGAASPAGLAAAGGGGWTWAITWDVDPGDGVEPAAGGPIATDIVTRVVSRASGGSIVRLQLGGSRTLEALPGILDGLASVGLRVAPLDEILGLTVQE